MVQTKMGANGSKRKNQRMPAVVNQKARVNPSAYQPRRHTHWVKKAGQVRRLGREEKTQIPTDVVKQSTSTPRRKNNLHSAKICYILVG